MVTETVLLGFSSNSYQQEPQAYPYGSSLSSTALVTILRSLVSSFLSALFPLLY